MKQNDYSTITSIEELRKCRVEAEARLCRVKKSIKLDYLILKKSLTFTNLVATMLSDFSMLIEEARLLRHRFLWLRKIFSGSGVESDNRQ
ncbi:MAG: hypothetical protein IKV17_04240 [Bacteroidaceae bacterium]|nr:hypothetical protein [Bacteroidaceae bacterium]